MTTAASGPITAAESLLATTVAGLSAFQTWVGAATSTAAAEHVYIDGLPRRDEWSDTQELEHQVALRPFALVWTAETNGLTVRRIAAPSGHTASGILTLWLEDNVLEATRHDFEESDRLFKNTVGDIIDDLMAVTTMPITSLTITELTRTSRDDTPTLGDAHMCQLEITWGVAQ